MTDVSRDNFLCLATRSQKPKGTEDKVMSNKGLTANSVTFSFKH